jgi:hypothetical protein
MLLKIIPREMIIKSNETELVVLLNNKSTIALKGADNQDSLRGVSIAYAVLDEYASMKSDVWLEIVRPMLLDTNGRALFIGTPKGKNHFWELWLKGMRAEEGYKSWQFKSADNPYIASAEIEEAQQQTTERIFRQEYEAQFEDYVGLIYPEYSAKVHLIDPMLLPEHWERIAAIDPAISGTTAALFGAVDESGALYLYAEYYAVNKRVNEVVKDLKSINNNTKFLIDPAALVNQNAGFSLYHEYTDNGIVPILANNDVDGGINRVAEYFKHSKIKIFRHLTNFQNEIERYHWSEERETLSGMMKPKPYKKDDHLMDCMKYIIASRPTEAEQIKKLPVTYQEKVWNRVNEMLKEQAEEVEI